MKYNIDDTIIINNIEWRVAEYRMSRGREWKYTLASENTDGTFEIMSLNERAMDSIVRTGGMVGSVDEIQK